MWCEEDTRTHSNRSKLENITLQNLFCFRISQYTYSQCSRMTTRESDDDYFVAPLDVSCTWTLNYSTRLLMMKRWNVAYESHLLPFHILANGIIFCFGFYSSAFWKCAGAESIVAERLQGMGPIQLHAAPPYSNANESFCVMRFFRGTILNIDCLFIVHRVLILMLRLVGVCCVSGLTQKYCLNIGCQLISDWNDVIERLAIEPPQTCANQIQLWNELWSNDDVSQTQCVYS